MKSTNKIPDVIKLVKSGFIENKLFEGAKSIERKAKSKAPKGTGDLAGDIQAKKTKRGAIVTTKNEAAIPQEFGTSRHRAQPFMRPAYEENADKIRKDIKSSIERKLKSI